MTVGDLIKNKDYDYISYRLNIPNAAAIGAPEDIFIGCCKSIGGELIPLDGDTIYHTTDKVVRYEEFTNPEEGIINGLEVVINGRRDGSLLK